MLYLHITPSLYDGGITSPVYLVSEVYDIPVHEFKNIPCGHWNNKDTRLEYYKMLINDGKLTKSNYNKPKTITPQYRNLYENYNAKEIEDLLGIVSMRELETPSDIKRYVEYICNENDISLNHLRNNWTSKTLNKYLPTLIKRYTISNLYKIIFEDTYKGDLKPPSSDWEDYKKRVKEKYLNPDVKMANFDARVTYDRLPEFVEYCLVDLMGCKGPEDLHKAIDNDSWLYNSIRPLSRFSKFAYGEFHNEVRRVLNIPIQDYPAFSGKWIFEKNLQEMITFIEKKYNLNEDNVDKLWSTVRIPELGALTVKYKVWDLACYLSFKPNLYQLDNSVIGKIIKSPVFKAMYDGLPNHTVQQIFVQHYDLVR